MDSIKLKSCCHVLSAALTKKREEMLMILSETRLIVRCP